jgi:hypothetical protein
VPTSFQITGVSSPEFAEGLSELLAELVEFHLSQRIDVAGVECPLSCASAGSWLFRFVHSCVSIDGLLVTIRSLLEANRDSLRSKAHLDLFQFCIHIFPRTEIVFLIGQHHFC